MLYERITRGGKKGSELIECKSMIVSGIGSDFYLEISVSRMRWYISWLIEEVPVRHVDTSSWREEWFRSFEHSHTFLYSLEMMEWREKYDDIIWAPETAHSAHRHDRKIPVRMKFSSLIYHTWWIIDTEIWWEGISPFLTLFEESAIPTPYIEEGDITERDYLIDNLIYLRPWMRAPTVWKCRCETIIECHKKSIPMNVFLPNPYKNHPTEMGWYRIDIYSI